MAESAPDSQYHFLVEKMVERLELPPYSCVSMFCRLRIFSEKFYELVVRSG